MKATQPLSFLRSLLERLRALGRNRSAFATRTPVQTRVVPSRMSVFADPDEDLLVIDDIEISIPAKVILFNDEVHTFDEVIVQIVKATGCSMQAAENLAFEVDTRGLACVFEGEISNCLQVSSVLEEIALHTTVEM